MNAIDTILTAANWEYTSPKEKLYSSDHVIDAYLKGKKDGLQDAQKLILQKLEENIGKSGKHTGEIISFLKKKKFHPVSAYLKINSWDDFTMLVVLPEKEFLSNKIISAYNYITDFENSICKEMYRVQISIADTHKKIDETYIKSDGFILKHKM